MVMTNEKIKACRTCGKNKPVGDFYQAPDLLDGLKADCKDCYKERHKNRVPEAIDQDMVRVCKVCGATKPLTLFKRNPSCKYGRTYTCKVCEAKRVADHYVNTPEKKNERRRLDYRKHKDKRLRTIREWHLRQKYGWTIADYDAQWEKQEGLCAVCGLPLAMWGGGKCPPVDHDHESGSPRGIVHDPCNRVAGVIEKCIRAGCSGVGAKIDAYLSQHGVK
jgi:hypothetical protein